MGQEWDHERQERVGTARQGREGTIQSKTAPSASQSRKTALSGTQRNAPDQIRTGDLRLERPTLFGPPEGPVDH